MRHKCFCNVWVTCQTNTECNKMCRNECDGKEYWGGYVKFADTTLGPMLDDYPESVKNIYSPTNQPPNFNYHVADTNPVNYYNEQNGLVTETTSNAFDR